MQTFCTLDDITGALISVTGMVVMMGMTVIVLKKRRSWHGNTQTMKMPPLPMERNVLIMVH